MQREFVETTNLRLWLWRTLPLLVAAGVALAGIVATSCNQGHSWMVPDIEHRFGRGFYVSGINVWSGEHSLAQDGDDLFKGTEGFVQIDGDEWGEHEVDIVEEADQIEGGGEVTLTVTDLDMAQERIFTYTPAMSEFTIADASTTIHVVKNPDKSYSVDGRAAANGKAAVALMKDLPPYRDASPWTLVMSFGVCTDCIARGGNRVPINCDDNKMGSADPPNVCAIFADFCDCALCDKLNKGVCTACP